MTKQLSILFVGFWLAMFAGIVFAAPQPSGVIGIVLVNAGSIDREDPIPKGEGYVLCATLSPAQPAYGFFQWGYNTTYMYNTRPLGPITEERRVCSSTDALTCDKPVYWRYFLIVDKVVLGFDSFSEAVLPCAQP